MHYNHKIKHAVTAALSIIAISYHPAALALGLSDIQIQSHLGETLKAKINVLGAADLKNPSCIKLGGNSDLNHVNFKLGQISGGNASLTLTSNKVVNEPILNLSVAAGCDSTIVRDYVLLLDPPTSLLGQETVTNTIENAVVVQKIDNTAKKPTAKVTTPNRVTDTKARKKKRSVKKASAKNRKKTTAKKLTSTAPVNKQKAPAEQTLNTQPRLSISGGLNISASQSRGLRLDKQLRFKPDPGAVINSENTDIADEVTVMNNRLAHLQAQITKLQKQNSQLTKDNQLKSEQLSKANASPINASSFIPFLGTGLLLLASYFGFNWLRRRQIQVQEHHTDAIWIDTSGEASDEELIEVDNEKDIFSDVDFGINTSNEQESTAASMNSTFESTKTEEEHIVLEDEQQFSVLDHADVFLSHGRAALAIQLLQNHLLEHPKQSVTIWLFLLDLLAKENLESLYKETAADCKLHFNVKISDFSNQEASPNESLEDFPRLVQGLQDVWNTPAATVYLEDLIYNNRLEPRAGLSKNLIEELLLLRTMAQENSGSADVIKLDEKKMAILEQKEALLESRKAEKLKKMEEVELEASQKTEAEDDSDETSFEFTLVER